MDGLISTEAPQQQELVPPEKPLHMPIQSLTDGALSDSKIEPTPRVWVTRALLFSATLGLTAYATRGMYEVVGQSTATAVQIVLVILFALTFFWIALSAVTSLMGFIVLLIARPGQSAGYTHSKGRTAVVWPIYNEDTRLVFASLQSMVKDLGRSRGRSKFDFFVLSDSTDLAIAQAEYEAALAANGDDYPIKVFYRRRASNEGKKSGNIAEFVRRWGGAYDYMIVLDADSYMTAEAMLSLVQAMENDPSAGLIQTVPRLRDGRTLFARLQQFASEVYGPVLAAGLCLWHGTEGNYWGHNAIIRLRAFAAACGLPVLRGRKPFGGHILSHDFVEAALLRRAGFSVYMRPDIQGSYEGIPPTFADFAIRDRRWAQGNLQHTKILPATGLHWMSRFHLLNGIMSYLASPFWLLFLLTGLLLSWQAETFPPDYFPDGFALFPTWPRFDAARALALLELSLVVLLLPKLLAWLAAVSDRHTRVRCGGTRVLTLKVLTEIAISALLAPVMMLVQSRFVAEILCGKEVGWATQQRELDHIKLRDVARAHLGHTLTGIGLAVLTFSISTQVWFWLSPIWLPLVLATPVIFLTSRTIGRDRNLTEFRGFEGNRTMQTASRGVSEAGQHR
jgi:membrane glycosyltransferase